MICDQKEAEVGIYTFGKDSPNRVATCQYIIDVSGMRDPGSSGVIRKLYGNGVPIEVQKYMEDDPRTRAVVETVRTITFMHLRSDGRDGKWLSFGVVDHHGKWAAPAVGEIAAWTLDRAGYKVSIYHADLGIKSATTATLLGVDDYDL